MSLYAAFKTKLKHPSLIGLYSDRTCCVKLITIENLFFSILFSSVQQATQTHFKFWFRHCQ